MKKALEHLRRSDPLLAAVIDRIGPYRMRYMQPAFGNLVRSIVYQQLSGKVAAVIFGRFVAAVGDPIRPAPILQLTDEQTRAIGLSKQKAAYVRDLASKSRSIGFHRLSKLSDDEVVERLTAVKGIGVWTAHMFLIFGLRRPNVLPSLDLGVRTAIRNIYGLKQLPSPKEVEQIGAAWQPYCSVASWYLWRSLEIKVDQPEPPPRTRKGL
jgi:DNA-3-methyladenine glycosylase II